MSKKIKLFSLSFSLCLILMLLAGFSTLYAKSNDPRPGRSAEYFESLGNVLEWVPNSKNYGYEPGKAKGAVIEFDHDFELGRNQSRWTIQKDVDGCRVGKTKCTTCDEGEICTLWLPDNFDYFDVD